MSTPRRDWLPEAILLIAVDIVATVVFAVAASSVLEVTARTASIDILTGLSDLGGDRLGARGSMQLRKRGVVQRAADRRARHGERLEVESFAKAQ